MAVTLQERVGDWHRQRFPNAQSEHVALKACEEMGELASAILGVVGNNSATGDGDPMDEAADVAICLMVLLDRWVGGDLMAAVERKLAVLNDPTCRCGHRRSKHGFMGHPDCTDGAGDFFCLCEGFEAG